MRHLSLLLASLLFLGQNMDAQNKKETLIQAAASPNVREDGKELLAGGFSLVPGGTLVENIPREHGVNIHLEKGDYTPLIEALRQHLNEPISDALIAAIKKNIVDFFREKKGIAVVALIPIQKIVNGNIILQILEGKVGRIEYKNQNWFSERVIRNALGIKVGDPLNEVEFLNDVTWLNRNPFRHTQMVLVPAKEKGMTDLSFVTTDRFPFRFYAGSDNCGYITNGTLRLFAGFNWGNAFMLGDLLSYQYTASSNFHNLQTHVLNYSSFLPWKNILTVFGCYGQVFPKIPGFKTSGINLQGSFRYEIPIPPLYGSFRSSSSFGFDYKFLTSNLFFVGNPNEVNPASNQMMAITQFLGNYQFQRNWPHDFFSMRLDMVVSPWKNFVPHQSTSAYTALRQGSHVRYAYWKSAINYIHKMKSKWTASFLARGQLSSATLPTAEQFGLGGADTVRGYFEQQFVADDALCLNFELYPPGFPLFKGVKNELAFLTFFDYGYGYNYTALDPQFVHQNLIGIGPGIRFDIPPYLTTKMDYGFQVLGVPGDHRTGRFHFAITASY